MKRYSVLLHGTNFDLGEEVLGFYTTRWVKAESPEETEQKAVELIRSDPFLIDSVKNKKNDSPMIYLDEIYEVGWFEFFRRSPGGGYTFYAESNDDPANPYQAPGCQGIDSSACDKE